MDLTTFRATHPGLYEQATNAGVRRERRRCSSIAEFGAVAGAPASAIVAAIDSECEPTEAIEEFRPYAARSDETAAAFVKKLALLPPSRNANAPKVDDDAATDALIARMHGGGAKKAGKAVVAVAGEKDIGDLFAESLPLLRTPGSGTSKTANNSTQPVHAASLPEHSESELQDMFASVLGDAS